MTGCNLLDFGTLARKNGKRLPCEVLQSENQQLRELLRFALLRCNVDNPMCDACSDGYDGVCELEQRMFELGVIE